MNIKDKAKELCEKSGCHHKCHDTKDCIVEDEAREYLTSTLTNEEKVSVKGKCDELNERKLKMIEMRQRGLSLREIGEVFNLSKQRVAQIIGGEGSKYYFKPTTPDVCIYPNLRKWMNDNRITRAELTRKLYGNSTPNNQVTVGKLMQGETVAVGKKYFDRFITITGLTYEQLFEEEK